MADSPLIMKSKEFALQIIKVCNYVKQSKKESVLTNPSQASEPDTNSSCKYISYSSTLFFSNFTKTSRGLDPF